MVARSLCSSEGMWVVAGTRGGNAGTSGRKRLGQSGQVQKAGEGEAVAKEEGVAELDEGGAGEGKGDEERKGKGEGKGSSGSLHSTYCSRMAT